MGKLNLKLLVEGGKASAGPPLGPTLAPLKVNIQQIVSAINEKTKEFAGIQVPVEVSVDIGTKEFELT
ncbi:MAG TPA: 50S ribosomal protein L11, partial [archaeon]|nr:50S ribosomal protein L11 [archaeon]